MSLLAIERINKPLRPGVLASSFLYSQHVLYVEFAQAAIRQGSRQRAMRHFDVACCYLRLALQKTA